MKVFFNECSVTDNCLNICPFNKESNIMIGSCSCQECKHCYGYKKGELSVFYDHEGKRTLSNEQWVKCSAYYNPKFKYKFLHCMYMIKNFFIRK